MPEDVQGLSDQVISACNASRASHVAQEQIKQQISSARGPGSLNSPFYGSDQIMAATRGQCLERACHYTTDPDEALKIAEKFYNFIAGGKDAQPV